MKALRIIFIIVIILFGGLLAGTIVNTFIRDDGMELTNVILGILVVILSPAAVLAGIKLLKKKPGMSPNETLLDIHATQDIVKHLNPLLVSCYILYGLAVLGLGCAFLVFAFRYDRVQSTDDVQFAVIFESILGSIGIIALTDALIARKK